MISRVLSQLIKLPSLGIGKQKNVSINPGRRSRDVPVRLEGVLGHYGKLWKESETESEEGHIIPEWEVIGSGRLRMLTDAHLTSNDMEVINNSKRLINYQLHAKKAAQIKPYWVRNEKVKDAASALTTEYGKGYSDSLVKYYFRAFDLALRYTPTN